MKNWMFQTLIGFGAAVIAGSAFADPGLSLLKSPEWKGECRPLTNEAGQPVYKKSPERLQSSYVYSRETLMWRVTAYHDVKCSNVRESSRFTLLCTSRKQDPKAKCTQIKSEISSDGFAWRNKQTASLTMDVTVKPKSKDSVEITTIGDSGNPDKEVLSR